MVTYEIIDIHAHLGDWHHYGMEEDVDALIRMMDLAGIERVCLNHLFGGDPVYSNGIVHAAMSRHPDRIVGFATLNLHYPEETDTELARCFDELGMTGIKVYPPHHGSVDRPVYDPVFAFARERRAPVLCHTFPGELSPLETVAAKYPEVAFILGHAGGTEEGFDRAIELATARAEKKGISVEEESAATNLRIPRGRMATPEEIADTVGFLASELAGHITGQSLIVDGGETRAL